MEEEKQQQGQLPPQPMNVTVLEPTVVIVNNKYTPEEMERIHGKKE